MSTTANPAPLSLHNTRTEQSHLPDIITGTEDTEMDTDTHPTRENMKIDFNYTTHDRLQDTDIALSRFFLPQF